MYSHNLPSFKYRLVTFKTLGNDSYHEVIPSGDSLFRSTNFHAVCAQ